MNVETIKDRRRIWFMGVVLPLLMLAFDPIVFRGSEMAMQPAVLGEYKPLFYTAIKRWSPLIDLDFLLENFQTHMKPSAKQILVGQVYEEATGRDAWKRAERIND